MVYVFLLHSLTFLDFSQISILYKAAPSSHENSLIHDLWLSSIKTYRSNLDQVEIFILKYKNFLFFIFVYVIKVLFLTRIIDITFN
jgi:hypothetical protein